MSSPKCASCKRLGDSFCAGNVAARKKRAKPSREKRGCRDQACYNRDDASWFGLRLTQPRSLSQPDTFEKESLQMEKTKLEHDFALELSGEDKVNFGKRQREESCSNFGFSVPTAAPGAAPS